MKIQELRVVSVTMDKLKISDMSIPAVKSLVALNKDINEKQKEFGDLQVKILESYDVGKDDKTGNYDWSDHEKSSEITKKMGELVEEDYELSPLNFIPEDEFYKASSQMKVNEITFLSDLLVKKD